MIRSISVYAGFLFMLLCTGGYAEVADAAKVHTNVQAALDWELPDNPCTQPKAPGTSKEIRDEQGVARTDWDVDGYTLARYERKEKRWMTCVDDYKQDLFSDQETLKNSAQYGLTEQQANIILSKMKMIQTVLLSPDGILPAVE
jgi:hypothetical protein